MTFPSKVAECFPNNRFLCDPVHQRQYQQQQQQLNNNIQSYRLRRCPRRGGCAPGYPLPNPTLHARRCDGRCRKRGISACMTCKSAHNKCWWQQLYPKLKAVLCLESKQVLHLQCCVCFEHGCKTRLFTTVGDAEASHCVRHVKTQKHVDAANHGIIGAPVLRLLISVLKILLGGKIPCSTAASDECDAGVLSVGGRHRIRNMLFCLAEAVRERSLQHL